MDAKDEAKLDIALDLLDSVISAAKGWTPSQVEKLTRALELRHSQAHDVLVDVRALFGFDQGA